jgi:hypothetical protein
MKDKILYEETTSILSMMDRVSNEVNDFYCPRLVRLKCELVKRYADNQVINSKSFLLPVGNREIINLKDGTVRERNHSDFFDIALPISYNSDIEYTDTFKTFLNDITLNNQELIDYLQYILGNAIAGNNITKSIFYICGTGNNGKSTLFSLIECCSLLSCYFDDNPELFCSVYNTIHFLSKHRLCISVDNIGIKSLKRIIECQNAIFKENNGTSIATIFIQTNQIPIINDKDLAKHIQVIELKCEFVNGYTNENLPENCRMGNPHILDEFKNDIRNMQSLLKWLVEGAKKSQMKYPIPEFVKFKQSQI